jgi:hypothetical protein
MEAIIGSTTTVFVALTLVIFGFAAFMAGQGLATTWRPLWQVLPYSLLLAFADRFFTWSLFDSGSDVPVDVTLVVEVVDDISLWSGSAFLICTAVLIGYCLLGYRLTRVRQMVRQYPWLYEQTSPLSWRERT